MGMFSSKKKYYVFSSTMNMRGSDDQMYYIPVTLISGALSNTRHLGKYLMDSVMGDSGINLRRYYNWSRRSGYSAWIGDASSAMWSDVKVSRSELAETLTKYELKLDTNQEVEVNFAEVSWFDPEYVAKTWCSVYRPTLTDKDYTATTTPTKIGEKQEWVTYYEKDSEGNSHPYKVLETIPIYRTDVLITFTNGSTQLVEMTGVDLSAKFLYYSYTIYTLGSNGQVMSETKHTGYYQYKSGKWYFDEYFGESKANFNTYFSIIPFRDDKSWLSKTSNNTWYTWASKAYKKATGAKNTAAYGKCMDQIKKSEGIDQSAFIYQVFGVSINTAWQPGLKFLYNYFYNLFLNEKISTSQEVNAVNTTGVAVNSKIAQEVNIAMGRTVYIRSTTGVCNYDTRISWGGMTYYLKTGKHFENATVGSYHSRRDSITTEHTNTYQDPETGHTYTEKSYSTAYYSIWSHQKTANRYEEIWVKDLKFSSTIYHGKSVSYSAYTELATRGDAVTGPKVTDDAIGESGFIIPLEWQTFRELSLFNRQDLSECCNYLVVNSWKKAKIRWYQKGWFKIFLQIVVIIIVIICYIYGGPAGGGASSAGSALTSSTASISAAAMAKVAVMAVIASVVTTLVLKMLSPILTKMFGETFGTILATIIAVIASVICCGYVSGAQLSWGELCSSKVLLSLTNAVGNAYVGLRNQAMENMLGQHTAMMDTIQERMEKIESNTEELFGVSGFWSQVLKQMEVLVETPEQYLTRTLLVGSDISQQSMDMLYDFPKLSLSLDLPGTS